MPAIVGAEVCPTTANIVGLARKGQDKGHKREPETDRSLSLE